MRTSKEALRLLEDQPSAFDICLKDHDPPRTSASRLLRLMAASSRALPPVIGELFFAGVQDNSFRIHSTQPFTLESPLRAVVSSQDDREMVLKCLSLGAIDYLVKPLRRNELRHIWTRLWWSQQAVSTFPHRLTSLAASSSASGGAESDSNVPLSRRQT